MPKYETDAERTAVIRKAWINWTLMFVPMVAVLTVAISYLGIGVVLPAMFGVLGAVLLYQRHVSKRTWHSIMWGVYATQD